MTTKKYSDELVHFKTRDFYDNFNNAKPRLNYFPELGKKSTERKLSYGLYCKIIKRFLLIYFYEVFFLDKPLFFILGGKIVRCRISPFIDNGKRSIKKTISIFWYLKPYYCHKDLFLIQLQTGKRNTIPKLRREFLESNDVGLLPLKKDMIKEYSERKILYKI